MFSPLKNSHIQVISWINIIHLLARIYVLFFVRCLLSKMIYTDTAHSFLLFCISHWDVLYVAMVTITI